MRRTGQYLHFFASTSHFDSSLRTIECEQWTWARSKSVLLSFFTEAKSYKVKQIDWQQNSIDCAPEFGIIQLCLYRITIGPTTHITHTSVEWHLTCFDHIDYIQSTYHNEGRDEITISFNLHSQFVKWRKGASTPTASAIVSVPFIGCQWCPTRGDHCNSPTTIWLPHKQYANPFPTNITAATIFIFTWRRNTCPHHKYEWKWATYTHSFWA